MKWFSFDTGGTGQNIQFQALPLVISLRFYIALDKSQIYKCLTLFHILHRTVFSFEYTVGYKGERV